MDINDLPEELRLKITGTDVKAGAAHHLDHPRNALDRNAVVIPFRQRLRTDTNQPSESCLRSAMRVTALKTKIHHGAVLQRRLIIGKPAVDCVFVPNRYNQLMVDKNTFPAPPKPALFITFQDWMKAWINSFESPHGAQTFIAKRADISVQAMNNWVRRGEEPSARMLQKLSKTYDLSHAELVLLARGGNTESNPAIPKFLTIEMLQHWNELPSAEAALRAIQFMEALKSDAAPKKKRKRAG